MRYSVKRGVKNSSTLLIHQISSQSPVLELKDGGKLQRGVNGKLKAFF